MSTVGSIGKTLVKGGTSSAIGGSISYFAMKRREPTTIFGITQPEWVVDSALLGAESLAGDAIGNYTIPKIKSMVSSNQTLQSFTKFAAPPAIVGLEHMAVKTYLTDAGNSMASEFMLGAGTKVLADATINSLLP